MSERPRTYTRAELDAARRAWDDGRFSDEWKPFRALAGQAGFIAAPVGSRTDQWDDDEPSERALLIRAIRETPALLAATIPTCRSWAQVIYRLIRAREQRREALDLELRDDDWRRRVEPGASEATQTVGAILRRIGDSVGVER